MEPELDDVDGAETEYPQEATIGDQSLRDVASDNAPPEKLRARRETLELTLKYIANERLGVEENANCMDPVAYLNRLNLLDCVAGWYHHEAEEIDQALECLENG